MERDQPNEEKKIWVDPELTFMPMKIVKAKVHATHEYVVHNDDSDSNIAHGS